MSKPFEIVLPKLGESIVNATIVKWLKKEGDFVQKDEALLEVATDKVNSEIPSPVSGTLKSILAQEDEEKRVGDIIAIIETKESASQETKKTVSPTEKKAEVAKSSSDFYSPAVLQTAKKYQISFDELEKIIGFGADGRVTKKDLIAYAETRESPSKGELMSPMRKAVADNMVQSFYSAPHASLFTEVDMTELLTKIEKEKTNFFEKHQAKLSITSYVAFAIAKTLPTHPYLNSSCEKDRILLKEHVNLGIAVHVEQGLVVPVINNAEQMDLVGIAQAIYTLATKARAKQLKAEDLQEGSVTLTNYGTTGVDLGLPIIRFPEAAVIGMGAIKQKPVVRDGKIEIRSMMNLSLTFDHRVCDGIYGCSFINQLKSFLEDEHH